MSGHKKQRVCVIGAGTAGLCALRHALDHGFEAIAYERYKDIGGTWICMEQQPDECEEDVHSSMYVGLRTNLPKEVMGYPDFDYAESIPESFIGAQEVLEYLQSYVKQFELAPHIKLQHEITRVRPRNKRWEVLIHDLVKAQYETQYFDFVLVCNGHYTTPMYPNMEGMADFRGEQLHSHMYRKAETLKGHTVLIVGGGPSGIDIAYQAYKHAAHIYVSHHLENKPRTDFMPNVTQKPDVLRFTADGAVFKDGSSIQCSFVIYCTGYKYTFPFLSVDCGVQVDVNYVHPLYKHCLSINEPTLAVIGLPHQICPAQSFDLQVRFALAFFSGRQKLSSRANMLADWEHDMTERWANGLSKRVAHQMGKKQFDYYDDLASTAGIKPLKPVIGKLMAACSRKYIFELDTYRNNNYKVIDDENFVKTVK